MGCRGYFSRAILKVDCQTFSFYGHYRQLLVAVTVFKLQTMTACLGIHRPKVKLPYEIATPVYYMRPSDIARHLRGTVIRNVVNIR